MVGSHASFVPFQDGKRCPKCIHTFHWIPGTTYPWFLFLAPAESSLTQTCCFLKSLSDFFPVQHSRSECVAKVILEIGRSYCRDLTTLLHGLTRTSTLGLFPMCFNGCRPQIEHCKNAWGPLSNNTDLRSLAHKCELEQVSLTPRSPTTNCIKLNAVAVSLRYRNSLCVWCMVCAPFKGRGRETHLGVRRVT